MSYHKHFSYPIMEDLLRLIRESSSSYMNKAKPYFWVEIGASDKSANICKIRDKKDFFFMYVRSTKF